MALQQRKALRQNPTQEVTTALHFGTPLLESAVSLIENGRRFYRGHEAIRLAQERPFEAVVGLLWLDDLAADLFGERDEAWETAVLQKLAAFEPQLANQPMMTTLQTMLPQLALEDWAAYELGRAGVVQTGVRLLRLLTLCVTRQPLVESFAASLQQAWRPEREETAVLLNMALVLCADHELNVSSFTARCVASAGATPYGVVQAGLAALQGNKHGGHSARATALLREIGQPANVRRVIGEWLRRGETIPGFGHGIYVNGDPRGRLLLAEIWRLCGEENEVIRVVEAVIGEVNGRLGRQPNIDLSLATLAVAFDLPRDAALTLFALGRTAGWLAHALEQYQRDELIRPRAKYVGRVPPQS